MKILFWLTVGIAVWGLRPRRAFGYAETHFRFFKGATRLYRPVPEIYFDCPWRINRGERIPLVLLVKDADRFPVVLEHLEVTIEDDNQASRQTLGHGLYCEWKLPHVVRDAYAYFLAEVAVPETMEDDVFLTPRLEVRVGKKRYTVGVSSHEAFSSKPLRIHVAEKALPSRKGWTYAETHTHSWHTSDQVEFGAPPEVIARMARALGLRWVFLTDHSFDLDVPPGKWFGLDPHQSRWRTLENELKTLNAEEKDVTLFRGEEVSCGTKRGKNVHLLVYGVPELIPGRGDGVKQRAWWRNAPSQTLPDVLTTVRRHGGLAFPAHPMLHPSLLERLLLNRGTWTIADLTLDFDGWEFWNTDNAKSWRYARKKWVRLLLEGWQYPLIAGSDAHGDFNRTRSIRLPFLSVDEFFREAFGKPRTGVYTPEETTETLFEALRKGRCFVTNGPFATLNVASEGKIVGMSETLQGREFIVFVDALSTPEFGEIRRVTLYVGTLGGKEQPLILGEKLGYDRQIIERVTLSEPGYLRAEIEAQRNDLFTCAVTNPVWINSDPRRPRRLPAS